MGSKSSTPQSPDSDDSTPSSHTYSRAERPNDFDGARQERSFMERAESSLHSLMYSNSPGVDIRRSDGLEHHSSLSFSTDAPVSHCNQPSRSGSIPPVGPNRSYSVGSNGGQASQGESTGSSISSSTGLSHFLSNFNLWRSSGPSGGSSSASSDRQRAQSLSHMPSDPASSSAQTGDSSSRSSRHYSNDLMEDLSALSLTNPRAALSRLLSSRETGRNGSPSGGGGSTSGGSAAGSTGETGRRESNGTSATFSVRDLTSSTAQEFLTEATLNGLGLGRVYVTHSLPSHMWAVNGN